MMPATVAYQGRPGAFSEQAAWQFLGTGARTQPCNSFAEVVDAVARQSANYGVLPIHNTRAGVVRASCRALAGASVDVLDELALPVSHALIALPGATLAGLASIYSHPVAIAQCGRFLRAHPAITPVADGDTAGAVEGIVHRGDVRAAAIASISAAAIYGATVLAAGIEDSMDNRTRFLLFRAIATDQAPD